jgi:hypothetical protein
MRTTCVGDANFVLSLSFLMRVVLTCPTITLLESHYTTYAHVSAVERLCLPESIDVLNTSFCKEKVAPFWGFHVNFGETKWTLECCLPSQLGEFSRHGNTREQLFSWTLEEEIVNRGRNNAGIEY